MTAQQTIGMVRMLLDDSLDFYRTTEELNNAIQDAQLTLIHEANARDNERLLRPLYRRSDLTQDGGAVFQGGTSQEAQVLYPKGCLVYDNEFAVRSYQFLPEAEYRRKLGLEANAAVILGRTPPNISNSDTDDAFPRIGYYTIRTQPASSQTPLTFNLDRVTFLWFNSNNSSAYAYLSYITYPPEFYADDNDDSNDIPLAIPEEYHLAVATKAASKLNDIDVGEAERGNITFENQRLTLENSGT